MLQRIALCVLFFAALSRAASTPRGETVDEAVRHYLAAADPDKATPWTINGSLGLTVTDGNSDTVTVTVGLEAAREWDGWKITLKASSLYAKSEGVETASEHIFKERLERRISERAWLFQDLMIEHDEQEELDYRILFTVGYKRQLVKKKDFELFGEIGAGIMHEEFRVNPETEGIAQIGVSFKWQISEHLVYTQTVTIYPSLSEGGEFRFVSESVFSTPIGERMDLRLSIIDSYDSNAPAGVENNDLTVALSLAIKLK